ncbi:hypothetical protein IB276_10725 [Ensifer sp. ENS04]|uniref:hypothetical protein n=1 Tax=Ensifer sp. ENS04 TaxID=2769281 RepID=UPI00178359BA|nr:hypothetical protein [Ensifer sp. ENS04]MBD9539926.1 hypothetical protein [Ensifer sp. ENS04]
MAGDRDLEKLEVLAGTRAGSMERAAVRIEDLVELLQIAAVRTAQVSAAPTAADFNSLLLDIKEINNRLSTVAQVLRGRLLR